MVFTTVVINCTGELPQALSAVTEIVPPKLPAVAVILFVVLVPIHPDGKVQVYDVAPETLGTL
jgi:hypothetical protein